MDRPSPLNEARNAGAYHVEFRPGPGGGRLAFYEFRNNAPDRIRILLLKLDHRGDLLIALPAIELLRRSFPNSQVTLVCGSWNIRMAAELGIADEVRGYDYFPEVMQSWTGDPIEPLERFRDACRGHFDLAIDLRVDEDTRPLLKSIDATLRCGIGSRSRHPYLDVILPGESRIRDVQPLEADSVAFAPGSFVSRMPTQTAFFHETDFSVSDMHMVYGPYQRLPLGNLRTGFGFQLSAPIYCKSRRVEIAVEVVRDGASDVIAFHRIREVRNRHLTVVPLEFTNNDPAARYEFRVFIGGRPRHSLLRFFGVSIDVLQKSVGSRFVPAELHRGEELSLLVQLIAERTRELYPAAVLHPVADDPELAAAALGDAAVGRYIVVAPFSNSKVKDWPLDRYAELLGLLLDSFDGTVVIVGSRSQETALGEIGSRYRDNPRLINIAGQTDWTELAAILRRAALVIANDTGVAHLAAACGSPTLAIYSGSNSPQEWGPRGRSVRVISADVPCSPCGHERLELCPYDHRCMTLIEPDAVLRAALDMLGQKDHATAAPMADEPLVSTADQPRR